MKKTLIIILALISIISFGQEYNYRSDVEKLNKNEFCKIFLPTDITAKLKNDFSDIRLYDSNNVEIPYVFQQEQISTEIELFTEYEIIEIEHIKRYAYTRLVIHNPSKNKINNIALRIKNADVRKHLKLNASYDNENWYVLKDNYYYNSINNIENTSEIRILNFPLSDYEYYELLIGDCYDKPINITQAGYYNTHKENGKYTEISDIKYSIKDSLKQTFVEVITNGNYIDKIIFDIDSPRYYYREAELFVKRAENLKKKTRMYEEQIANINLISNSSNSFNMGNLKEDTIYIKINNNDNQALNINEIKFMQLNKYLIAELGKNKTYYLKFSDKKSNKPNYDLKYFTDSIPENLTIISTSNIVEIKKPKLEKNNNFNLNSYWLWFVIIIVAGLLFYMSYKMIKDNNPS